MSWNELTEREKMLDRAIDRCGVKIDGSKRCLQQVMRAIGAKPEEEPFVADRIALRIRTQEVLGRADSVIDRTEKLLDFLKKDDKRWKL